MTISEMFQELLNNLKVDNAEQISLRYEELTACLNKSFRETDSKTANSLQVGSYGRWTAIKGVSDLDMLYIMPKSKWDNYKDGKQSALLKDTKDAIKARYPKTEVFVAGLVVRVLYTNYHVEVQPVFEQDNGSFKFPDTSKGGRWRITKPREEIDAMKEFVANKNSNLRRLCKMTRAWKNKHGVNMGGLLIDTLAYNFLKSTSDYDDKSYLYYNEMNRDFFKYLSDQPDQEHYKALGSGQNVNVKKKLQKAANKAYELCLTAIDAGTTDAAHEKWKKVFGRPFPSKEQTVDKSKAIRNWDNTEIFVEDKYSIDVRYTIKIDCEVSQPGFRKFWLRDRLINKFKLSAKKELLFQIKEMNIPSPFNIEWKVLNRGEIAKQRNCIRGQIIGDAGHLQRRETSCFRGEHIVECYAIQNGVVVAKDRISVPIQ